MKSLFTVLIILLFPVSIFGIEVTIQYPMKKSNGSFQNVKMTVPNGKTSWEPPYLAGRWRCEVYRGDSGNYFTVLTTYCFPKGRNAEDIFVMNKLDCNDKVRGQHSADTNENSLTFYLSEKRGSHPLLVLEKYTQIILRCKL